MMEEKTTNVGLEKIQTLTLSDARDLLDIVCLFNALLRNEGNITRAAEELDIGRRTIYDLMDRYGISCTDGKICIKISPLLKHIEICARYIEKYLIPK